MDAVPVMPEENDGAQGTYQEGFKDGSKKGRQDAIKEILRVLNSYLSETN